MQSSATSRLLRTPTQTSAANDDSGRPAQNHLHSTPIRETVTVTEDWRAASYSRQAGRQELELLRDDLHHFYGQNLIGFLPTTQTLIKLIFCWTPAPCPFCIIFRCLYPNSSQNRRWMPYNFDIDPLAFKVVPHTHILAVISENLIWIHNQIHQFIYNEQ